MQGLRPEVQSLGRGSQLWTSVWPPLTFHRFGFASRAIGERGGCSAQRSGGAIAVVRGGLARGAAQHRSSEEQPARGDEDELVHPDRNHPRRDSGYVESCREPYSSRRANERADDYQDATCCRETHTLSHQTYG